MSEEPLITVDRVSKAYRIWDSPASRLASPFMERSARLIPGKTTVRTWIERQAATHYRDFFALSETSFTVGRGESLGIIGRNGSGKSTLLQIIAGTMQPTTGSVTTRGRIGAMLELGSGFNPEFTGQENVFLSGAVLGIPRQEMEQRFDAIAAFADIGEFLNQPIKTYSSGMAMRLAFAVQTAVEPEILIVDEALAVGDIFFQSKCYRLLSERIEAGMTLLLVSHDPGTIKRHCQKALVLHAGKTMFVGDSAEAANRYAELMEQEIHGALRHRALAQPPSDKRKTVQTPKKLDRATLPTRNWASKDEIGSREVEILHFAVGNAEGRPQEAFALGETIHCRALIRARQDVSELISGFCVNTSANTTVYAMTSLHSGLTPFAMQKDEIAEVAIEIPGKLCIGDFILDFGLGLGNRGDGAQALTIHRVGAISIFS